MDRCLDAGVDAARQATEEGVAAHLSRRTPHPTGVEPTMRQAVAGAADPPGIGLSVQLPHDPASVTLVRHLVRQALSSVGVIDPVIDDVELALSEACTNVVSHAGPTAYEVTLHVRADCCELQVIDKGRGFDYRSVRKRPLRDDAERGRGLAIMGAVMDRVDFLSEPEQGTVVTLVKQLAFDETAPAHSLLHAPAPAPETAEPPTTPAPEPRTR